MHCIEDILAVLMVPYNVAKVCRRIFQGAVERVIHTCFAWRTEEYLQT